MEFFKHELLENELYLWLIAFLIIVLVLLLTRMAKRKIFHWLKGKEQKASFQALLGSLSVQTRDYFIIVIAFYLGMRVLRLGEPLTIGLHTVTVSILLLQIGFWGTSFIDYWIERRIDQELISNNPSATTLNGLGIVARVILWAILIILMLENITGIEVNTLVASLGITGVAVALAVQNILSDLFASLSITLDRPFVIGDFIEIGTFSGTVEHIGLKSTRVRSLTGEQLVFSNSDLLGSRIRNFKRMSRRRAVFNVNVPYWTGPEHLERIPRLIEEIIRPIPEVTFDRAHFKEMREAYLAYEVVYFMETPDYNIYMDTQQVINLNIVQRFGHEGIDFYYPAQQIKVGSQPPKTASSS